MKKLLFSALGLLLAGGAFAQTELEWGVKAGLNVANLTYSGVNSKPGIVAGVFCQFKVNYLFTIQPELVYSRQGCSDSYHFKDVKYHDSWRINYLNLPILARIYILDNFSVDVGPQFGLGLKMTQRQEHDDHIEIDKRHDFHTFDFSIPVGISYDFPMGLIVSVRYNVGFTNVIKDAGTNKNSVFQFSAGWKF